MKTLPTFGRLLVLVVAAAVIHAVPAAAGTTYVIQGGDMGMYYQNLNVWDSAFTPIPDAIVTVNGIVIPNSSGGSWYSGTLDAPLSEGDAFTLEVQIGADTVVATDVVPELPVITAPADGSSILAGSPLLIEWTSTTDPERYWINAHPCVVDCNQYVDGTVRSVELPTDGFSTTEPVRITVLAYHGGTFTGPAEPESNLNLRMEKWVTITTLPGTPTETSSWAELKVRFQ